MSAPLLSICCITYNHEKYIRDTIEGFLGQKTNFKLEIIIHDDASKDKTPNIIKEYNEKDIRIIPILRKTNIKSTGVAIFPLVFEKAKGKYIAMCEGDDYWTDPLKLQKQVDFLEKNPTYAGSFHETAMIFEDIQSDSRIYGADVATDIYSKDTFTILSPFHTSSFVFKKNAFDNSPFLKNIVSGDMAIFSIVSKLGPIRKVPGVMSVYRKHLTGITASKKLKDNFHQERIKLMKFLDEFHEFRFNKKAEEIIHFHKKEINKLRVERIKRVFIRVKYIIKRLI